MTPLALLGVPGSPYTRKMLALLRYRRIPYRFLIGSHRRDLGVRNEEMPSPKVALLPTFYFTAGDGTLEAVVDSTPIIRRLERDHADRSAIPSDPAAAFFDTLLEDYADEWLTKAMFHYRWRYAPDIAKGGAILPRWSVLPQPEAKVVEQGASISERQISRLHVVGSNDATAAVIEASYGRFLDLLRDHLEAHPFIMGARPGAADFATYGQLTQLVQFDPTPAALALARAPRVYAWVDVVDDLSGLEPSETDWLAPDAVPDSFRALLAEVGRVYAPALLANARALAAGAATMEAEIDGQRWAQSPFPYQARCLQLLRAEYAGLDARSRGIVDQVLHGTGCEALFAPS